MSIEADLLLQGRGVFQNAGQGSAWVQAMGVYQRKLELRKVGTVTTLYKGFAAYGTDSSSAKWLIQRIVFDELSGLDLTDTSAGPDFNQIWDNRESLTYV